MKNYINYLNELALYDQGLNYYNSYLEDIKDSKLTLNRFNIELMKIKNLLSDIDIKDIILDNSKFKDNENYIVKFNYEISSLINKFYSFYLFISKNNSILFDKINNSLFNGETMNLEFDVIVDRLNFNKYHFPIDLPIFLKNIGLGKKIISKSIIDFEYCQFSKKLDSFELKFSVDSITKDINFYSFMKDSNLLIFNDDFNTIQKTLKKWFEIDYNNYTLDKNFHLKYKTEIENDKFLNEIYKKYHF